jgi:alcohol dehydrogenase class IV
LHIPGLAAYGVEPQHLEALIEKGAAASSMKANPLQLVHDMLLKILTRAL